MIISNLLLFLVVDIHMYVPAGVIPALAVGLCAEPPQRARRAHRSQARRGCYHGPVTWRWG